MKKIFNSRLFVYTIFLFLVTIFTEGIIRNLTDGSFFDFSFFRIILSSFIFALIWSYIAHFFNKTIGRIIMIVGVLFIGIYEFIEFGLYNFIGFFMGIGNAEQGTKVMGYIIDFISNLKPAYYLILVPMIIGVLYFAIGDTLLYKRRNKKDFLDFRTELLTILVIFASSLAYFGLIRFNLFQNKLQTESTYSLWIYPENSNLAVNNYGVLVYGMCDIKSIILGTTSEDVMNLDPIDDNNTGNNTNTPTDYTRKVNDAAWQDALNNTTDSTFKSLNNFFYNREVTPKNEYTGIFEGKNLIIILMESVNEISILNEEYFPTLYKMYHEGISFRNNFTPRNNCSTGNNEFTVLSSLFTINNTCTANTYASNSYFEGAFNVFNDAGYKTTSYHDYTQKYYKRNKIHTSLGSSKFYGVTDLGIPYDDAYEEWPSDVDMYKQAQEHYMYEDKFMVYFATVTTHQTYYQSSTMGDKYMNYFKDMGYSTNLARYLSKMKTLDEAMAELLSELESTGKLENTVIAMFGDHFPYGLSDANINEYLKRNNAAYTVSRNSTKNKDVDRTPMIIYNSGMEPKAVYDYTTIIDLLPTLMNMFNVDYDPRLYLGTDIFSESHDSRAAFADGSWADERGFYYAPNSKMTYNEGAEAYTNEEIAAINKGITTRQKMSATAIKNNYFKYLGKFFENNKVEAIPEVEVAVSEEENKEEEENINTESEE